MPLSNHIDTPIFSIHIVERCADIREFLEFFGGVYFLFFCHKKKLRMFFCHLARWINSFQEISVCMRYTGDDKHVSITLEAQNILMRIEYLIWMSLYLVFPSSIDMCLYFFETDISCLLEEYIFLFIPKKLHMRIVYILKLNANFIARSGMSPDWRNALNGISSSQSGLVQAGLGRGRWFFRPALCLRTENLRYYSHQTKGGLSPVGVNPSSVNS